MYHIVVLTERYCRFTINRCTLVDSFLKSLSRKISIWRQIWAARSQKRADILVTIHATGLIGNVVLRDAV